MVNTRQKGRELVKEIVRRLKEKGLSCYEVVGSGAGLFPSEYLGQSVSIGEHWGWTGWWPPELLFWWVTREAPTLPDRWVLLVRPDIAGVEQPTSTGEP